MEYTISLSFLKVLQLYQQVHQERHLVSPILLDHIWHALDTAAVSLVQGLRPYGAGVQLLLDMEAHGFYSVLGSSHQDYAEIVHAASWVIERKLILPGLTMAVVVTSSTPQVVVNPPQASTMLMVTDPKPSSGQNTTANHGHDVTHKVPGSPRQSPTPAVPLPITEPISPPMTRSTNGDQGPSQPTSPLDPMLLSGPSAISTPDTATCMDLLGSPVDPNPEDPTQTDTLTELQQFLDKYDGDLFSTLQ